MKRFIPLFFILFVIFGCERENIVHTETYTYIGLLDSFYSKKIRINDDGYKHNSLHKRYYGQINSDTIKVIYDSLNFEYHFQIEDTTFQLKPNKTREFYSGYRELFIGTTWDSRYTIGFYVDSIVFLRENLIDKYIDSSNWGEEVHQVYGVLYRN